MINIVYCGNRKVIDGMYISALSILKHTKEPVTFHILTMDLTEVKSTFTPITNKQISTFNRLLQTKNKDFKVLKYDVTNLFKTKLKSGLAKRNLYTPYALLRLLLDKVVGLPSKVLYLDTDVITYKSIAPLYNMSLTNLEGAAVVDFIGRVYMRWFKKNYFNSGVMLYNLDEIRKNSVFSNCRKFVMTKRRFMLDQDALNIYMTKYILLEAKYNGQNGFNDEIVIEHFSKKLKYFPFPHFQNIKPWDIQKMHKKLKLHVYDDILEIYLKNKKELNEY